MAVTVRFQIGSTRKWPEAIRIEKTSDGAIEVQKEDGARVAGPFLLEQIAEILIDEQRVFPR